MPKEYAPSPEVEQIAEKLVKLFKSELEAFEIRYIFCNENPKKDGRECIGLARKVVGLNAYLAGCAEGFFVLETGKPAYDALDENGKLAYVLHELCHFGISDEGNISLIPHDIQEFCEVVKVFGAYRPDLQVFYESLQIGEENGDSREDMINRLLERRN